MIAAIFDVDRTILPTTSAERLFLRYLWRTGRLGPLDLLRLAWHLLKHPSATSAGRAERIYLRDQPVQVMEAEALVCWQTMILPRLSSAALEATETHRRQGHAIVLLTGAPDLLMRPLATHLKVEACLCSSLEREGDRYTGRIVPPHPYGPGKREVLTRFARERSVDLSASFAYADSLTDLPVLEAVGHPAVINPTALFRRHAEQRGWPIMQWR